VKGFGLHGFRPLTLTFSPEYGGGDQPSPLRYGCAALKQGPSPRAFASVLLRRATSASMERSVSAKHGGYVHFGLTAMVHASAAA
jgi:hypothetical protein